MGGRGGKERERGNRRAGKREEGGGGDREAGWEEGMIEVMGLQKGREIKGDIKKGGVGAGQEKRGRKSNDKSMRRVKRKVMNQTFLSQ